MDRRNGASVRLSDVAEIRDAAAEKTSLALFNGKPALVVHIVKVQGANTIAVADGVFAAVAGLQASVRDEVML